MLRSRVTDLSQRQYTSTDVARRNLSRFASIDARRRMRSDKESAFRNIYFVLATESAFS
jgi:hypothetical protein